VNSQGIDVSIIIPIKNEGENLAPLANELEMVMSRQPWSWECVWIDDGSTDGSLGILQRLTATARHHRYFSFEHNAGQSAALFVGFKQARGVIFATIDGDGQNDPADIPPLVNLVRSGAADMANGYRHKRKDTLVRKLASRIANGFRNWVTGNSVRDVGCSTRALRRECVASLPQFAGMHRFLPTLVVLQGFRLAEAPVNHRPRLKGQSKYTINNRLWVGLVDTFGVLWLRKRAFHYTIKITSDR
jgi:dolichol-phosphate mannosyltransferase